MESDIYRQLQRHLDIMPVPFPATESGVELRLLKHLFTEEEASIAVNLSALPEPVDKIHKRFKKEHISKANLKKKLDGLFKKGAIMAVGNSKGEFHYSKIPLAIGIFEYQVDRITREFAEEFYRFGDEGFAEAILKPKVKQIRTIPVNMQVEPKFPVGQYDSARQIIQKSNGPFAVMNCVCRQAKDSMDDPCKQTKIRETCITMGQAAQVMKTKGVARYVSKEGIIDLLTQAEKVGMVLQPQNTQSPTFICCCCGCCCGVLTAAKKFDKPAEFLESNFRARVNTSICTGCEDCMALCQMDALVSENNHVEVNPDRCIGCGVCINACPGGALHLEPKEKQGVPPRDSNEMYRKMVLERYGVIGALKLMGKVFLGQKI